MVYLLSSFVESFINCSRWAWVCRGFQCCGRCHCLLLYQRCHAPVSPRITDLWHSFQTSCRPWTDPRSGQSWTRPHLDPLHFVCQPRLGVQNEITCSIMSMPSGTAGEHCEALFFFFSYFSSAFNIIRPTLLGDKLTAMPLSCPGL